MVLFLLVVLFLLAITFDDRPLMDHNVVVEASVVGVVVDIRL